MPDLLNKKSIPGRKGGARPGAGRPKGSLETKTIERKKAEQEMIQRIVNNLEGVLNSQLTLARGLSYLYRIDETGEGKNKKREHVLVTDPGEIKRYLDSQLIDGDDLESYYYITTKDPDERAIENLVDRVFGKPSQKIIGDSENPLVIQIVNYGTENNNDTVPVPTPGLPAQVSKSAPKVQNRGTAPKKRKK